MDCGKRMDTPLADPMDGPRPACSGFPASAATLKKAILPGQMRLSSAII